MPRRLGLAAVCAAVLAFGACAHPGSTGLVTTQALQDLGPSSTKGAANATLIVQNNSRETIEFVYVNFSSRRDWGADQLGSHVILAGNRWTLENVPPGQQDIQLVDRSGHKKFFMRQQMDANRTYQLVVDANGWRRR